MLTFDPENMLKEAIQKARDCFIVGELDYGQEILEQVLRCEPNHQAALQLLGVFHHRCRRYEVAMPYFAKAIELDPQNADNYNNLALCQSSVGRVDDAIQSLNKAIELNPKEAKYLGNIALQYRHIGAYLAAIESLERFQN
jgi:tetratricopeptide (TPR) repeat protein